MPTIIFILNFCKLPWTQEQNKQTLIHHHEVRRIVQKNMHSAGFVILLSANRLLKILTAISEWQ